MIRQHRKTLIITSLLTLLPIPVGLFLLGRLPETLATHWGIDGQIDGWSSAPVAIILPPVMLLAAYWICVWFTAKDPGNKGRNKKPMTMVLWIIPVLSNATSYMMYALALGVEFSPAAGTLAVMGLMFVVIGNYMPKTRMNSTIGIKVPWAYTSEANWSATHRFGGKMWVVGGIVMMISGLLPETIGVTVMLAGIIILAVVPIVYSWLYYRKQKARGDALIPLPRMMTNVNRGVMIFVAVVLLGAALLLFTGDIAVHFGEKSFTIEASYYQDLTVSYDVIESVEYREGNVDGSRVGGYGSPRLLMGFFQNEEFGTYTRYTYYQPESCIVLTTTTRTLVISGETAAETNAIYQELLRKTGI